MKILKAFFIIISSLQLFISSGAMALYDYDDYSSPEYRVGSGDKLRIVVFGETDLSGEFELDGSGKISLPLIGSVNARKLTINEVESKIETKLRDGYLLNPKVSVEVLNYRPFYVLGEVNIPGSYPYVNSLTVINAVALAGGYTHRARTDDIVIRRKTNNGREEFVADDDTLVLPGDVLRVEERFF